MPREPDRTADDIFRELWAPYSETVIDHAHEPRNVGSIENADGYARIAGSCGDTMEIWLLVKNEQVKS